MTITGPRLLLLGIVVMGTAAAARLVVPDSVVDALTPGARVEYAQPPRGPSGSASPALLPTPRRLPSVSIALSAPSSSSCGRTVRRMRQVSA